MAMKVYALDTNEDAVIGLADGISLYSTRQQAEEAVREYEEDFGPGSAWVVELNVL
jgi:hypothetical protein